MRVTYISAICLSSLSAAIALAVGSIAFAESILWNTTQQVNGQFTPNITISYYTRITNLESSELVACGGTVPKGARLRFEFLAHEPEHIYWFAAGYTFDSPYGDWIRGAAQPANVCVDKNYFSSETYYNGPGGRGGIAYGVKQYVALSAEPPIKSVLGLDGFSCVTYANNGADCTADTAGSFDPAFSWDPTFGHFYNAYDGTQASWLGGICPTWSMNHDGLYTLPVPTQSLSCPITVKSDPELPPGEEPTIPTQPSLSASAGNACRVGTPLSISMSSTDPEGDPLRYLIDWNDDGSVDQFLPAAGYVPSGTSLSASRTYATEGSKTVRVRAQDENGTLSPWATFNFNCANFAEDGFNESGNNQGDNTNNGASNLPPAADLQLRVIPSLVRSGNTTKVNWSASNVQSCTVSAPSGDSWTGLSSPVGGATSKSITSETRYTLSCIDLDGRTLTKTATVRVLPTWRER